VYSDSEEIRKRGREERDPDLRLYAECRAKDHWPAYPEFVQPLELPRWASKDGYNV
jgi:hypothetical protein